MFKKELLGKIFNFIVIYTLFLITILFFANYFGLDRHWSTWYDHELTMTYNALLFNSGIEHEQVNHSGYFTILFLSIFF